MGQLKSSTKPFEISKWEVKEAWESVRENKGAPGVDGQSINEFEKDLRNNLYKVWNRMSSAGLLQVPQVRGLLVMPRIVSACSGSWWMARVVLATLSAPRSFRVPMARLRKLAMARGAFPA